MKYVYVDRKVIEHNKDPQAKPLPPLLVWDDETKKLLRASRNLKIDAGIGAGACALKIA